MTVKVYLPTSTMSLYLQRLCSSALSAARAGSRARLDPSRLAVIRTYKTSSSWDDVPTMPPDAILGLNAAFREDSNPKKVNLGVGAYRTDEGEPYVLPVVKRMEQELVNDPQHNHEYFPQDGVPAFNQLSAELILGKDSPAIAEKARRHGAGSVRYRRTSRRIGVHPHLPLGANPGVPARSHLGEPQEHHPAGWSLGHEELPLFQQEDQRC